MTEMFFAYLLVENQNVPSEQQVCNALRELFPDMAGAITDPDPNKSKAGAEVGGMVNFSGEMFPYLYMEQQMAPDSFKYARGMADMLARFSDLEYASRIIGNDRGWPMDLSDLGRVRGYIKVSALSQNEDFQTARHLATLTTMVAAAIVHAMPTVAVYWQAGDTLSHPQAFINAARRMHGGHLPLLEWVQIIWAPGPKDNDGDATVAVLTDGLRHFVGRELEIPPNGLLPPALLIFIHTVLEHVMANGLTLSEGMTIGINDGTSDELGFHVSLGNSIGRENMPAVILGLRGIEKPRHLELVATPVNAPKQAVSATPGGLPDPEQLVRDLMRSQHPQMYKDLYGNDDPAPPTVTAPAPAPAPVQSAAAPTAPPPPPASGAGTPRDPAGYDVKQAEFLVRAMARSAKTDDRISDNERAKLDAWFRSTPLAAIDHLFLDNELAKKRPVEEIVYRLPPELAEDVYAVSVLVVGKPGFGERRYLNELAKALELDPGRAKQLETEYAD